jgi:hypothetical protein
MGRSFTLLLPLASAVILRSEFRGTCDHILLSQIQDSPQPVGPGPCIYEPSDRMAQSYPQVLNSLFDVSCDSPGYCGCIQTRLHAGTTTIESQSESRYTDVRCTRIMERIIVRNTRQE